eukprot:745704-Hanusia_phi.AAC.2
MADASRRLLDRPVAGLKVRVSLSETLRLSRVVSPPADHLPLYRLVPPQHLRVAGRQGYLEA